jgi:hypothetical protein
VQRSLVLDFGPEFNANPLLEDDVQALDPFASFKIEDGGYMEDNEYKQEVGDCCITPAHPVKKRSRVRVF